MDDHRTMIRNTFEYGSVRDARELFEKIVRSAFPASQFRGLELIRFLYSNRYMEGRSWNHVFEMWRSDIGGQMVWEVRCRRVSMGKSPERTVYLDFTSLEPLN